MGGRIESNFCHGAGSEVSDNKISGNDWIIKSNYLSINQCQISIVGRVTVQVLVLLYSMTIRITTFVNQLKYKIKYHQVN